MNPAKKQSADSESLKRSYDFCREIAKSRAKNFYYSFIVLPAERRRAMCAVYAFMRYCDDIVDEEAGEADKEDRLNACREYLDRAYDGSPADAYGGTTAGAYDGSPADGKSLLPAFRDTVERFDIPRSYFDAIIDGAQMDLTVTRYATFEDLYQYCYRVASAVGLVCIHIFGFNGAEAKKYAESCGIAFQLTNILRDLREDAEMSRIYLPQEDLDAFGYPEEHLRSGRLDDSFRRLMEFQVERARSYYDAALPLLPLVQSSSRACLAAMIGIYRACLEEIPRRQYDVYSQRIGLSPWKKISITARALIRRRV
ncbi:MAG: presqualene diphosphate synthase HpnD [Gemmatimonadetes bacterium]|nr:presqualene diphosphate synthase HpnD [Gemmatimonadota bacterium]